MDAVRLVPAVAAVGLRGRVAGDVVPGGDELLVAPVRDQDPEPVSAISRIDAEETGLARGKLGHLRGALGVALVAGATTYWLHSAEFRNRFPAVDLRPDVLFVEDGRFLTSAGLAAGIDLCLHIVRSDYGAATANSVARLAVVAPVRPGGQAQFIDSPLPPENGSSLAPTRAWAAGQLHEPLTLADLAAHAHTSIRTLTRRFHAETGLSPLQWLLHQRVDRARELLETTSLSVAEVASRTGLGTPDSLRQHLRNRIGLTPSAYRAAFTRATPS